MTVAGNANAVADAPKGFRGLKRLGPPAPAVPGPGRGGALAGRRRLGRIHCMLRQLISGKWMRQFLFLFSLAQQASVLYSIPFEATEQTNFHIKRIHVRNITFVDETGRHMFFRGVNVVFKDPPYLPDFPHFHSNLSFIEADVDFLVSMGVNMIRIGLMWPGIFPEARGKANLTYLERVREVVRMCFRKGVYTLLDLHQDELHPNFCGEGVPDWWVAEFADANDFPLPLQPAPFPSSPPGRVLCDTHSSFSYIWTHAAARAYQALYGAGAADIVDYWTTAAAYFAGEPGLLGGEVLSYFQSA